VSTDFWHNWHNIEGLFGGLFSRGSGEFGGWGGEGCFQPFGEARRAFLPSEEDFWGVRMLRGYPKPHPQGTIRLISRDVVKIVVP
jgi:hypothetical protein